MQTIIRRVTFRYDEFGWDTLESAAKRGGRDLDELLGRAVAHYGTQLDRERTALLAPRFKPLERGRSREVELRMRSDRWERLRGESGRQGVPLQRLLEHAPVMYIADLVSGRASHEDESEPIAP